MFAFLTASQNMPFTIALTVMLGIALLEGVTALFGAALSDLLDALIPDLSDVSVDTDIGDGGEIQPANALSRLLSWFRVGEVPVLMLLIVFLTAFGLIGLGLQSMIHNTLGFYSPGILASIVAIFLSLPIVRVFGGVLSKIMPKDETDAIPVDSLVGHVATITIGTAAKGRPAEARARDIHSTTHYLMVEPDSDDLVFNAGDQVLLVKHEGPVFKAIPNSNPSLIDD